MPDTGNVKLLVPVVLLASIALAACSDGETRPVPTPPPTADARVEGPWVTYLERSAAPGTPGRAGVPGWTITTYSLSANEVAASFGIDRLGDGGAVLVGDRVIVDDGYALNSYTLHGGHDEQQPFLTHSYSITGMALSPDGTTLALTYRNQAGPVCDHGGCIPAERTGFVRFVDARTAEDRGSVYRTLPALEGFVGEFDEPVWLDDNSGLVVRGLTPDGGPGSVATVSLDGSAAVHDFAGGVASTIAPDGRHVAIGGEESACGTEAPRRQVRILELETGRIAGEVSDAGHVFRAIAWSPDGSQLMYDLHTEPILDSGCLLDASSRIVFVLDVQRGLVTEPGGYYDEFGVHRGWYGDRAITYTCDGVRQLGPTCGATGFEPVEIYVGDDLIASAIEPQILGFIEEIEAGE